MQIRSKSSWTDDRPVVRDVKGNIYKEGVVGGEGGDGLACLFIPERKPITLLQKLSLNKNFSERTLIGTVMIGVYRSDTNFVFTLLIFAQSIASL